MSFNMAELKAKRRYEINKGIKNFDVKSINPCEYKEDLYMIQIEAFSAYPEKYRPTVSKDSFLRDIEDWSYCKVFGAFFKETNELAGYALLTKTNERWIDFNVLKTKPDFEKYGINAALIEKILSYYSDFLSYGGIICDGARSISHETNFQDYLEKYFGFRKAYCKLHIEYNPKIKWIVKMLFPIHKLLCKLDSVGIVHQINAVLKMEEICREQRLIE